MTLPSVAVVDVDVNEAVDDTQLTNLPVGTFAILSKNNETLELNKDEVFLAAGINDAPAAVDTTASIGVQLYASDCSHLTLSVYANCSIYMINVATCYILTFILFI